MAVVPEVKKPQIIAFMGVMGSGKDYRASHLQGYARVDFKDALLDLCSDIAGYDVRQDYEWFKEAIVGVRRPDNVFLASYLVTDMKKLALQHPEVMTGRRLLQRVGSDAMRKRDQGYWVKAWFPRAARVIGLDGSVAVADCRFSNEYRAVREMGGKVVFCDYRSPRYDAKAPHESERLAQQLLALGLRDGDEVLPEHIEKATSF